MIWKVWHLSSNSEHDQLQDSDENAINICMQIKHCHYQIIQKYS